MSVRLVYFLLFLLAALLLALGIWMPTGLTGKDEFYLGLRTPMEMIAGDHWLVPFLDGAPRIRKPPFLYWLGRGSYELFGVSLVSARGVAVLFGALLVLATAGIARRLSGDAAKGLLAGAILLACLGLHSEARRFMLDVPVAALSACAFWSFLNWLEARRWPWLTLAAFLLAAAFLTKGPVALVVCGAGVLGLLAARRLTWRDLGAHWPALSAHALLFAALALPWFWLVRVKYPAAAQLVLADELESRQFFSPTPGIVLGLINIALPWGFAFLLAAWRRRRETGLPRLLLVWFLASFLPFFFIKSFDRYLIGSLVPVAILLAVSLPGLPPRWPWRLGLAVAVLFGGGLAAFTAWFGLGGWYWLILPALYLVWAWWRPALSGPELTHTLAAPMFFWIALLWGVFPAIGVNAVPDTVRALGETHPVTFYGGPQPALLPILNARPHRADSRLDADEVGAIHAGGGLIFAENADTPGLIADVAAAGYVAVPAGSYKVLASHGSGLRFARVGATADDWRAALRSRDLAPLMTTVEWFEVRRP